MTFYEAALQVLEREGKPLHFKAITNRAVADKLLSHVGKDPEAVMYSRLAAMARRKGDRRVVATEAGTFGLLDWGVQEDPAALEAQVLPVPDESEVPYRPRERHPAPARGGAGGGARGDRWRQEREDRQARRKLPSLPELAFEALAQAKGPVPAVDLASQLREGERVASDLGAEALLTALREDNRRRVAEDRRPLFILSEAGEISVDRAGAPGAGVPVDLQAAFAQALGVPLEGERREPGRAEARPERLGPGAQRIVQQAREHQKAMSRLIRRRFGDLESGGAEIVTLALLEAHGFRDVRAVKRGKEGLVFAGRRRDGLLDVRFALRVVRGAREITKQDIVDLRTDISVYNAQVGVVVGAGDPNRDARAEALGGSGLVLLWVGEALAEKLLEKKVGSTSITVELVDLDDGFFRRAREQGDIEDRRREERRAERESREEQERAERASRDGTVVTPTVPVVPAPEAGTGAEAPAAQVAERALPTEAPAPEAAARPAEGSASPVSTIEVRVDLSRGPQAVPSASPEAIAAELAKSESDPPVVSAGTPSKDG